MRTSLLILLTFLLLAVSTGSNAKNYGDINHFKLIAVHDGDTFTVSVPDFPPIAGDNIPVRVRGVDTPELKNAHCSTGNNQTGCVAKRFTQLALASAKKIELRNIARDKYFRIDADVIVDGQNLADLLIAAGLGKPYTGGTKQPWPSNFNDIQQVPTILAQRQ